jgi:cephalosporin hydroxylase
LTPTGIEKVDGSPIAWDSYHEWYYNTEVWKTVTFLGVPCYKSVSDLWNYQEILAGLRPQLVIEFGTLMGGSTLYFAEILKLISRKGHVLSVDLTHSTVYDRVRRHPAIELLEADTLNPVVAARITELRKKYPGPAFWIIDDAHKRDHVLAELKRIRDLTLEGDYVVVEDGNVNGHPVLPDWGPGPYEALSAYFEEFPDDYTRDTKCECKFGFTFAASGFLIRRSPGALKPAPPSKASLFAAVARYFKGLR